MKDPAEETDYILNKIGLTEDTLRDIFAALAMQGYLVNSYGTLWKNLPRLAEYSYATADAMMAAKKKDT